MKMKWTRPQIDLIMNMRKQNKTYGDIVLQIGKKYGVRTSVDAVAQTFARYRAEYDLKSLKSVAEVKADIMKQRILNEFLKLIEQRKYIPIMAEFTRHTKIDDATIRKYFQNLDGLIAAAKEEDPKVFSNIIDSSAFNEEAFKDLQEYISKYKRFVVTSAITNCAPHLDALDAIKTYCKANKAGLLILPCSDPARQKDQKDKWSLDSRLPKESIVFKDISLNDNLILSTIKMTAKQLKPLTGLKRISQKRGSAIFASPKQFIQFASNSNNNTEIPRMLATTGAITVPEYNTDMYMSERLAYMSEIDHTIGAMIVEIQDERIFYSRPVQFERKTGAFCDLNKKYHANGKVETITAELIQFGDYHVLSTDADARKMGFELVTLLKPDYLTLEDFFDGITINPHERKNLVSLSQKAKNGLLTLETELKACQLELNEITKLPVKEIIMKYGNHEDFLKRWICDGAFMQEPQNKILGMKLNLALEELGVMPFEFAMRELFEIKDGDKVRFLAINDSFKVNGIENGAHGHLGKSGHRNPGMEELEDCYGACNTGHNHSAEVFRSVFRAGTKTKLQLSYNDGPSAWTQSDVIQHRNGTRQLITYIYGEYRLRD